MIDFSRNFESEMVLLRPLGLEDYQGFKSAIGNDDLWTYFTSDLSNDVVLKKWIETGVNDTKNKTRLALTIIDKNTNLICGSTSLGNISYGDKRVEIGWTWLGKKFQGNRINDHAKFLLLKYCFEELGFERVEFKTDVLNISARKALNRIGAVEEGILRSHTLMTHNRRRDTIYYSILKSEWDNLKYRLLEIL